MPAKNQYTLQVRFGDDLLEAGFTAVPNLFLNNYRDLGISDAAAFWIVHLLKFKWTEDNPYPRRSAIPMKANKDTQKRYARQLRDLGFLFTKRIYWSAEDNPPNPHLVGTIRAMEYDFTSLFHNVVRLSRWKSEGHPLEDFEVEIPLEIAQKVASGHFHHVPKKWKRLCEKHATAMEETTEELEGENHPVEQKGELKGENHTLELQGENHTLAPRALKGENHTLELRGDFQPVENHPHNKKDTVYKKRQNQMEEEEQQQDTWPPAAAVVVSINELKSLHLQDNRVILNLDDNNSHFATVPIAEVVRHELRYRRSQPFYEAEIYYSVQHALGEGPDDWTDEELDRIRRKQTLERELGQRHARIGAFTLEEALRRYFSSEFAAEILQGKSASELERIGDCVAYVRRQKNLTNPAGFLRVLIESGETPPSSQPEIANGGSSLQTVTSVGRRLPVRKSDKEPSAASEANLDPVSDLRVLNGEMTPQQLWSAALGELQLQMPRATFDAWLKNTHIVKTEEDRFTIACANPYAQDWLEERLNAKITRTLASIVGRPVTVEYEVAT